MADVKIPDSLPWRSEQTDILDHKGDLVGEVYGDDDDAAYIIHAANVYPALVGALKLFALDSDVTGDVARAALKAAGVEK